MRFRPLPLSIVAFAFATSMLTAASSAASERPNIIWLMLEDWSPDLGCYGTKGIETPHVDRLAASGEMYLNDFCTAPVCSSSRSAMITGFHQNYVGGHQHDTKGDDRKPLPYGIKPFPVLLRDAGYFTALMISEKTHHNFDADLGFMGADWNERANGQPFFAQITLTGTHRPWSRDPINPIDPADIELPPYYTDTPLNRRDWANGLEQMQICDREVGALVQRLEDEGLSDNTVIFLIGDNGRCHIRGKQFLYEPGLQVPLIVNWPDQVKPGQVRSELVQMIDVTATILDAAQVTPPYELHGKNLWSEEIKNRDHIFAARGRMGLTHDASRTVRGHRYKLIHNLMPERAWLQYSGYKEDNYPMLAEMSVLFLEGKLNADQAKFFATSKPEFELYDLAEDPHELENLADSSALAAVKTDLLTRLNDWREFIRDEGVSDEFRYGGRPDTYPTRSLEGWKARQAAWQSYVFRAPDENVVHPFKQKY